MDLEESYEDAEDDAGGLFLAMENKREGGTYLTASRKNTRLGCMFSSNWCPCRPSGIDVQVRQSSDTGKQCSRIDCAVRCAIALLYSVSVMLYS